MGTIADFFFIAGLEDDHEFEFTKGSVEESVSKQVHSVRYSRLVEKREVDGPSIARARPRKSSKPQSVDPNYSPHDSSLNSVSNSSRSQQNARDDETSAWRSADDAFASFRTDSFVLTTVTDPQKKTRRLSKVSPQEPSIDHTSDHMSEAADQDEGDQFEANLERRFTPSRRDRGGLLRKLSNSSTLRALNVTSQTRRPDSRQSIITITPRIRRISQAYSHVTPDPEPLILPAGTHPLKTKFPPRLLARYPEKSSSPFPQFLPMFAFPNDISIVLSDTRPEATWHGFSLTRENGDLLHGMCLIVYVPLSRKAANRIEKRCLDWRLANIQLEQREMSATFATKLANEKTTLSKLLLALSQGNPTSREKINQQINECEERVALYSDLLRPVRHGAQASIEGLTAGDGMWIPRALGVLSHKDYLQGFWKTWLQAVSASYMHGELLNIPSLSKSPCLPLERYVVNLCSEAPLPPTGRTKVELSIRSARVEVLREAANEVPGSRSIDLYPLFRCLSIENVVLLWEAAVLESRIIFVSKHPSMLSSAAAALKSLIFPFKWQGIYIPILPRRLVACLEGKLLTPAVYAAMTDDLVAPTPYIMGIDKQFSDLDMPAGDDVVICDLDDNILQHNMISRLPEMARLKLNYLLSLSCPMHSLRYKVPYGAPPYCIAAFPSQSVAHRSVSSTAGPPLADLLTQSSSSFGSTAYLTLHKPNLNLFIERNLLDKVPRIVSNYKQPRSEAKQHRPTFSHSLSSFAASMRIPEPKTNRASLQHSKSTPFIFPSEEASTALRQHVASPSMSSLADASSVYSQAYAPSTAATTCMNFDTTSIYSRSKDADVKFSEGHRMQYHADEECSGASALCDYTSETIHGAFFVCTACQLTISEKHIDCISIPCLPMVFDSNKVRASFIRCTSSLLYNYRKYFRNLEGNTGAMSFDRAEYERDCMSSNNLFMRQVLETQAFATFIDDRSTKDPSDPDIRLFDDILLAKRNRGRSGIFGKSIRPTFLLSQADAPRKTFTALRPNDQGLPPAPSSGQIPVPDFLDERLLSTPRIFRGSLN